MADQARSHETRQIPRSAPEAKVNARGWCRIRGLDPSRCNPRRAHLSGYANHSSHGAFRLVGARVHDAGTDLIALYVFAFVRWPAFDGDRRP
jgi:hypothetical protein